MRCLAYNSEVVKLVIKSPNQADDSVQAPQGHVFIYR